MKPTPAGWPRFSSSVVYQDAAAAIDWLCSDGLDRPRRDERRSGFTSNLPQTIQEPKRQNRRYSIAADPDPKARAETSQHTRGAGQHRSVRRDQANQDACVQV